METITEDRWDEDIWGIEHDDEGQKRQIPKLIFYFGENDHWVANHTRDALIAARGRTEDDKSSSKPIMMVDDNGVDHGFCIRRYHSTPNRDTTKDMTNTSKATVRVSQRRLKCGLKVLWMSRKYGFDGSIDDERMWLFI